MDVKIKRIDNTLPLPEYKSDGAAAFDLYSRVDLTIQPGEVALIPTNLIIATPPGHVLLVVLRSSTPRRKGLTNPAGIGVIDPDYCGPKDEVMIQVGNFIGEPVKVERGERLAQGMIIEVPKVRFIESEQTASQESRGGFGSTGTK